MDTFTILGEPTRRSIVEIVAGRGELTATEIGDRFDSSLPAISQHLKVLRDAGILRVKKQGRQRLYQLNIAAIEEIDRWAKQTKESWNARFDRLDTLLSREARAGKRKLKTPK